MECDRVELFLNGYVDGELDLVTALDIEEHLQHCARCADQRRSLERMHVLTSDRSLYHTAPAGLEKRIRASIKKADAVPGPRKFLSWQWLAPAAALAAILLFLFVFFGHGLLVPTPDARLAQEVQDAHLRSLMADHLLDVPSSDQHTVKPWFDGKLDFSPPVTDLTAQGFPLTGGRLDYVDGHPVAALVYHRNKHVINLFIWPSQEKISGLQSSTDNGYNLFHWSQSGMTFWAISDLNATEMKMFIHDFPAGTENSK